MITIAHRLNTIADYDKVIVMRRGRIVEQGSPWELIERKGQFADMVKHTGKNAELIMEKAGECNIEKETSIDAVEIKSTQTEDESTSPKLDGAVTESTKPEVSIETEES